MMVKDYHPVYDLNYHLILVTKYRRKVLNDIISSELKEMFNRIGENTESNVLRSIMTLTTFIFFLEQSQQLISLSFSTPTSPQHHGLSNASILKSEKNCGKKSFGATASISPPQAALLWIYSKSM